jgi:tartrate-resistant acid phosphatase type 5
MWGSGSRGDTGFARTLLVERPMRLSRRNLLSGTAGLTASTALPLVPATAEAAQLPFVLIGDWGRYGTDFQTNVADQMGKTAAAIGSQFTVSIGDNFYEYGVTGLDDPYWQLSYENIYTADSLQSPWKIILGNHDYCGNVQAQLDYSHISPRWQLPARYYSERVVLPDGGGAEFFYLDSSPFISSYAGTRVDIAGQDTQAQTAWLDNALGKSTARWKIVIGHHPIYTPFKEQDKDQADMIARIDPILRAHNVPIYINGHYHLLQSTTVEGITYVTNGAGSETYSTGAITRNGFTSSNHGFMTVKLSSEKLDFALVDMSGNTLYTQTVTPG